MRKKIVLISCVKRKLTRKAKAKNLYISPLFKLALKYARSLNPDGIFILSARYGLVGLDEEIAPYDQTLNDMRAKERMEWTLRVIDRLSKLIDMKKDRVIFIAGENYRKYLIPYLKHYDVPLHGLSIGKQLRFLKAKVQDE